MTLRIGRAISSVVKSINNSATVHFVPSRCIHPGVSLMAKKTDQTPSSIILHGFKGVNEKHRENFLSVIESYKTNIKEHQGCVDFIKAAMKYMEEFGVHKDLEVYKNLIDIMPKGKYIPKNVLQAMFDHYPLHQQTIVDLLDQMEHHGVIPDREMEDILLNIFGRQGLPLRKYWRMMYWMPKFLYVNPWLLDKTILGDSRELAKFALRKMTHIDPATQITTFETKEIPDNVEDTWVVSAMSPAQEKLLSALPVTESLYVEGPHKVWMGTSTIDYLILRGDVINRQIIEIDEDDVSDIKIPYHELKKVGVPYTVHEQTDGTYYAMCVTGTSSKDSALSWIRYLQTKNPILSQVAVVFKLKSPTGHELVNQTDAPVRPKKESQKLEATEG